MFVAMVLTITSRILFSSHQQELSLSLLSLSLLSRIFVFFPPEEKKRKKWRKKKEKGQPDKTKFRNAFFPHTSVRATIHMTGMMLNQRTSGFIGTPTVSKSTPRTTMRTTFTIESGLSTTARNNKRSKSGKKPISVPKGVTADLKEGSLKVKVCFLCALPWF